MIRQAMVRGTAWSNAANAAGIEAITLSPRLKDFNDDLRQFGVEALRAHIRVQLAPQDVARFMALEG